VNATTIEAVEGDRVRIYVTNRLAAPTTVHWHGVYLPTGMDGVSGLTQRPIPPGGTFKCEMTLRQHGTYMYYSHHDTMTQEGMGLIGMFIIHPREPSPGYRVDRDFAIMLSEWRIDPGTYRPDPNEMNDFNVLTMNGKAYPGTEALVARMGDRIRIRLGNLSQMDHHPIHLHGHYFNITATDGAQVPVAAQWPETSVLVAVGQTRDIEFVASEPGDWAMHCHTTHHVMNQMGHEAPNMVGVNPGPLDRKVAGLLPGYMTMGHNGMGGMFTIVKIREHLDSYGDPGWYEHPPGTVAEAASVAELGRDGIDPSG
jgi:FtsP/CotA-like multicopper oxidase with cupredoxin domain